MKNKIFILLFLLMGSQGYSQLLTIRKSVYFETDKYQITAEYTLILQKLIDSLGINNISRVNIRGNTDNVYDSLYNISLSKNRAYSARKFFIEQKIDSSLIHIEYFGKNKPLAPNTTDLGKQKNRRVDIEIKYKKVVPIDSSAFLPSIWELYRKLEQKPQSFCINPGNDTILRCEKGSILYFKANSFKIPVACKNACLTIEVKEDFLKSEMILDVLSTTSNGALIESQGMIYTAAYDCKGNKLELLRGKEFVNFVPTDSVVPGAGLFEGHRNPHDSTMNWLPANNRLTNIGLSGLTNCYLYRYSCEPCKFFFCRLKRFYSPFVGMFNRETRYDNKNFRTCQHQLKRKAKTNKNIKSYTLSSRLRKSPKGKTITFCNIADSLFEKYGVNNIQDLIYAMNKPLMDKYGVKTLEELQKILEKEKIDSIEMNYRNKKISYDDFRYYIYSQAKTGWANIDCVPGFKNMQKVRMTIKVKPEKNIDCRLIWKYKRIVLPAIVDSGYYVYPEVPVDQDVWLMVLKYVDGKPFMCLKEITSREGTYDVEFKEYSLEELKSKLKTLDRGR